MIGLKPILVVDYDHTLKDVVGVDTFLGPWYFNTHFVESRSSIPAAGFQELFKTRYFIHQITLNVAALNVLACT